MTDEWNPRFVAYCVDHGHGPDAHDGSMCGFVMWIGQRWREWRTAKRMRPDSPLSTQDHAEFDCWLNGRGWTLL